MDKQAIKKQLQKVQTKKTDQVNSKGQIKFPWLMFSIALLNDLPDYILLFVSLTGIGLAITETLGNLADWTTGPALWLISHLKGTYKKDPLTKIIIATLIESVPFGDALPSWTVIILIHYFQEKALAKTGMPKGAAVKIAQKAI